ncbi:hypothetical protein LC609_01815 [Nostoc sp. XA013]|nr:hypothetical protein [Nostoc sp. XA013]
MTHDNIGDRWDKANIHDFRGIFGGYVRERVDVQILHWDVGPIRRQLQLIKIPIRD